MDSPKTAKFWHDLKFYIVTTVVGFAINGFVSAYQKQADTLQNVSTEITKINTKLDDSNLVTMRQDISRNEYRVTMAEKVSAKNTEKIERLQQDAKQD